MKVPWHGKFAQNRGQRASRNWIAASGVSAVVIAAILALAIAVNLLIGRQIHWDIVTAFGVGGWVLFTVVIRRGA